MLDGMRVREERSMDMAKIGESLPLNADDEDELGLARHVEVAILLR